MASKDKDLIVSKLDPKIPLKEVWTADESKPSIQNPTYKGTKDTPDPADKIGADAPYVMINDVPITNIEYLVIDETDFIPKIKLIFKERTGAIAGPFYPKNNPIASVYIRPQNPKFKPIRCDFLITSVKSDQDSDLHKDDPIGNTEFIMTGELFVPKIYDNVSKSYKDKSSKDALSLIAADIDLGYASNDFITNDKMTWINPNRNYLYFINDVARHAYLDDDTFFKAFIDKYYHINFINVTEQLNPNNETKLTFGNTPDQMALSASRQMKEKVDDTAYDSKATISLTNNIDAKGRTDYILNYTLVGDNGRILKNKGYKRKIYYYDHTINGNKFVNFYVNPIKIKGYSKTDKISNLIPDDDKLKESIVKKWMSVDYGNTHREWNASVLINDHNNSELEKIKMIVETQGVNFQLTRGMGLPITIMVPSDKQMQQNFKRKDSNKDGTADSSLSPGTMVVDDSLTGRYFINGVKYIYDVSTSKDKKYRTEFHMTRMNWMGEKNILENNAT